MEVIKDIRTRRGANLNIKGKAEKILDKTISASNFALMPDDFFGTTPKLLLKEGDSVEVGALLGTVSESKSEGASKIKEIKKVHPMQKWDNVIK